MHVCTTRGTGQPSSQEVGPGRTVSLLQSITVESKSRISMVLPVAVTAAAMMENPAAALLGRRVDTDDTTGPTKIAMAVQFANLQVSRAPREAIHA